MLLLSRTHALQQLFLSTPAITQNNRVEKHRYHERMMNVAMKHKPIQDRNKTGIDDRRANKNRQWKCCLGAIPISEAGALSEQQCFLYCFGFLWQSEESVVLHAGLPEGLAHIATGHGELQSVFAQRLGKINAAKPVRELLSCTQT